MKKIFKYSIGLATTHQMDPNARFLHCENGVAWFLVDVLKAEELRPRKFRIFGTGHEIPEGHVYLGTFMDKPFVWHLFEEKS